MNDEALRSGPNAESRAPDALLVDLSCPESPSLDKKALHALMRALRALDTR
jgi:hypothetical protein